MFVGDQDVAPYKGQSYSNVVGNRGVIREEPELIDSDRKELEMLFTRLASNEGARSLILCRLRCTATHPVALC